MKITNYSEVRKQLTEGIMAATINSKVNVQFWLVVSDDVGRIVATEGETPRHSGNEYFVRVYEYKCEYDSERYWCDSVEQIAAYLGVEEYRLRRLARDCAENHSWTESKHYNEYFAVWDYIETYGIKWYEELLKGYEHIVRSQFFKYCQLAEGYLEDVGVSET